MLQLVGGAKCKPPVSYQGSKRGYAHSILARLGLTPGQSADAVLLVDPGPWSRVWSVLVTPEGCREVAATIRGWIGEEPRALWNRLKAEGPLDGNDAARWLYCAATAYRPGTVESGCAGASHTVTAAGIATGIERIQPSSVARYLMLSASNRLICADWTPEGEWKNCGAGGTTHGGAEFATPADKVADAADKTGIDWPPLLISTLPAERVDPADVAKWLLLHRWSFSEKGPQAGYGGPVCVVKTERASWTTAGRDACLERPRLAERVEVLPGIDATTYGGDAADLHPQGDLTDCVVYIDPPYRGTTGYRHKFPRESVVAVALRWAACNATVCVSEAEPIEELVARGWYAVEITADRKGHKRTFSAQKREWLTCNQPFFPLSSDNAAATSTSATPTPRRSTMARPRKIPPVTVETITGNVKSADGAPVSYTLSPKTLIVGRNATRKSAIVNLVELALTAAVSDIAGRLLVKREIDLLTLAPSGGVPLLASAKLSSGVLSTCEIHPNATGGASKAKRSNAFDNAFPLRDLRENLTGTPEKARAWFLSRVGAAVNDMEILRRLPEAVHAAYTRLVEQVRRANLGLDEIGVLFAVIDAAKKQARDASANADALEGQIRTAAANLGANPTDDQLAQAQADEAAARDAWMNAARAHAQALAQAQADEVRRQAVAGACARTEADLREKIAALQDVNARWSAACALVAGQPEPQPLPPVLTHLREVLDFMHTQPDAHGLKNCIACRQAADARVFDDQAAAIDAATTAADAAASAFRERDALAAQRIDAYNAVLVAKKAFDDAAAFANTVATAGAPVVLDSDLRECEAAAGRARTALDQLRAARAAWAQLQGFRDQEGRYRQATTELKQLVDAAEVVARELFEGAVTAFEVRVQAYLPESDVFRIQLRDGERDVCRFGIERAGRVHTALSGGEWARLQLALASAIAEGQEGQPVILVPEDRAWDPQTLREVLVALADAPCQVIFPSTIYPSSKLPAGWTVIDLDGDEGGKKKRQPSQPQPQAQPSVAPAAVVSPSASTPDVDPIVGIDTMAGSIVVTLPVAEKRWYYRAESDSYAALTPAEFNQVAQNGGDAGLLVEIGDDAAKAKHEADGDNRRLRAWNWTDAQIAKLNPRSRAWILSRAEDARQYSVLPNGTLFLVGHNVIPETLPEGAQGALPWPAAAVAAGKTRDTNAELHRLGYDDARIAGMSDGARRTAVARGLQAGATTTDDDGELRVNGALVD